MRALVEAVLSLPMPFLFVYLTALACWRWKKLSLAFLISGNVAFCLTSVPVIGLGLLSPLTHAQSPDGALKPIAIVVPTAGIFHDGVGSWWASSESIRRVGRALVAQKEYGVQLIVSGGNSIAGQPAESMVIGRQFQLSGPNVILEMDSRDSFESGQAVAGLLADAASKKILLVTSEAHMLRMAASMRHAGLEVTGLAVRSHKFEFQGWTDFLPSRKGLVISTAVTKEYAALAWYLLSGRVSVGDLVD
jgi:uncharacterized SAM-binding protein YcdF (DUF218 family)